MFSLFKRSGRLAGIYTTYAGMLFGATWLLDRWLVWQLHREVIAPGFRAVSDETRKAAAALATAYDLETGREVNGAPRCSVWTCDNAPVATIHGWDVCGIHDPRTPVLPNGQPADVKGS